MTLRELQTVLVPIIKKSNSSFGCGYFAKFINQNQTHLTKWQKTKPIFGCCYIQDRRLGTLNPAHIVKSPYKTIEIPNVTLPELLWDKVDKFADYTAIECGITGRKYTFAQLQKLSQRFAVSLLKSRIKQGQTVAVISQNCPEYPIIVLGCMEAGLIVTLVNYIYTPDEICHQLKDSGTVCVISSTSVLPTAIAAIAKVKQSNKTDIKVIALDTVQDQIDIPSGVIRFSELVRDTSNHKDLPSLRTKTVKANELAILPYSSGTTGLSKGVKLSHLNLVSNVLQFSEIAPNIDTSHDHQDVCPGILPFYHIYGFTVLMAGSHIFGSKVVTLPKFEQKTFINVLENHECSLMYIVPPLVLFLASSKDVTNRHFRATRYIVSGAAPIGENDMKKCLTKIPKENNVIVKQAYGLTETSPIVTASLDDDIILASVGFPVCNTEVKFVNVDNGDSLGPNQTGELCVKGPQVMMGYHNNPKATAATIDTEGWLHTGDVGYYDDKGHLFVVDRIKELIKVKGFQVPPAELEELLRSLPGVQDAGVVGIPDQRAGEVPIAYVVQSANNPASKSDITLFVSQKAAPYKQFADIVFVNSIPKSSSGKILRREIKEEYLRTKSKT